MQNLDQYLNAAPDDKNHKSIVNQLKGLQKIAYENGYGDLFQLSKEELAKTIESSGAILGEAVYRMICLVRRYTVWAYDCGLLREQYKTLIDLKSHPAMQIELDDIHVRNVYQYHLFRDIDELLKFIGCCWIPGEGQYAPVVAALCWCGVPYKDCTDVKNEDVVLSDENYIIYKGKKLDIPKELAKVLKDYQDTDSVERRFRGTVILYARKTDKFIKMFTLKKQVECSQSSKVSISRELHAAIRKYNELRGAEMDSSGPDIYLSGRLVEAKSIYDEFGSVSDEELGDIFFDGTKTSKRKIARIRYNLREYIAFMEK